ncbi:MAG TPA: phosphoribosylformylglycinamidine cyclo-ligase [Candidatus Omnitrophica bacterium]|nr:phosphoribosylformylglycinamidine cyclo-ligase [Candidatus Omnitrophota bacterium]HBH96800.1 phosphoribosylformylglycinamidine cyclo-ligase [Candidatus Omnitrophota bacterium]HBQ38061.1 phosphoribosylformylglycinamidine cyclo-ligase [Candidatus Omnitrophota bacterium]
MVTATTYRQAGVDIEAADRTLARLAPLIRSTHGPEVLPDRGQFASLVRLPSGLRDPVLVSSTDGVGTKLKVAELLGDHAGIGIDLVAMNVNDLVVYGARPLFFLDYLAVGKLNPRRMRELIAGIVKGCQQSGCALVGGETAEMPGVYRNGDYDVAGFCVGVVERRKLIDGSAVRAGDIVIGLASSGIHANGFSLVRKVFGLSELKRWRRELLTPTRIYVKPVLALLKRIPVTAIAHVTGGGLARRLPSLVAKRPELRVTWQPGRWTVPPLFGAIQRAGRISTDEMFRTFNMGVGMALSCRPRASTSVLATLRRLGVAAWPVGTIERNKQQVTSDK